MTTPHVDPATPPATQAGRHVLRRALRASSGILSAAFGMSLLYNVLRLSGPMFMLLIYDRVLPSRSQETLLVLFAMVAVLLLAMGLFDYARRRLLARFAAQFQERVEAYMFASSSKEKFFNRTQSKPIAGLDELDGIRSFVNGSAIALLDVIWVPMFLVVVFVLHPLLGWVAVGGVGVLLCLTLLKAFAGRSSEERARQASGQISALKQLTLSSREVLRAQEMTAAFNSRWLAARATARDRAIEAKDRVTWFQVFTRQARMLVQYSVLGTGAYLTLRGELSIGAMVAATFLVVRVILPVEQFLNHLPNVVKVRGQWARLHRVLSTADRYSPPEIDRDFRPSLRVKGVSCRSSLTNEPVLRGLTFDVAPGQIVEISGNSGAGKTALAEVLLGIWGRSAGSIQCGGQNIDRFNSEQASRIFGYLPEQSDFLDGTLAENISHLDPNVDLERVHEVARLALIHKTIMALPDGYQTRIGGRNARLSKGQHSRIAFARALYHAPQILILDEPDALLRGALRSRLQPMLNRHKAAGGSVIVLTRQPLQMANTDVHMQLDQGRLQVLSAAANVTALGSAPDRDRSGEPAAKTGQIVTKMKRDGTG